MARIQVLDQTTIDKIAAGEVIERPASIVKELAENAIDAGANTLTVEIEDGGITLIRITDNGCGILKEDIRNAFLRHSTSKIRCVEDLSRITSLGFRGEALSSIAAVTKVELVTKPKEETFGVRYVIEGGREISMEETGAADGTRKTEKGGKFRKDHICCAAAFLQCACPQEVFEDRHDGGRTCARSSDAPGAFPSRGGFPLFE